jgi:prevent-host-death family protein
MSDLKTNPAKYFDLASTVEVIVTRRGKPVGRIVSAEPKVNKKAAAFNRLSGKIKVPDTVDDDYDALRAARMDV